MMNSRNSNLVSTSITAARINFAMAISALLDNRLRSILSLLGIMIGVSAVIAIGSISRGGSHFVYRELETFGLNSIWISRLPPTLDSDFNNRQGSGLSLRNYNLFTERFESDVSRITARVYSDKHRNATNGRQTLPLAGTGFLGVDLKYLQMSNDTLAAGRWFNQSDVDFQESVTVLGPEAANILFGSAEQAVNNEFVVEHRRFLVVGVLNQKNRDFLKAINAANSDLENKRVILPYTVMQQLNGSDAISTLQMEAYEFEEVTDIGTAAVQYLQQINNNHYAYKFTSMASHIQTADRILNGVALIGIVAASISLLVGGLGIANVMSIAVIERTQEIGLRKAIGATRAQIQAQFLFEAGLISMIGGVLGLLFGGTVTVIIALITNFPVLPSAYSILAGIIVSLLTGLLSGWFPAKRAAALHPVDALRSLG